MQGQVYDTRARVKLLVLRIHENVASFLNSLENDTKWEILGLAIETLCYVALEKWRMLVFRLVCLQPNFLVLQTVNY